MAIKDNVGYQFLNFARREDLHLFVTVVCGWIGFLSAYSIINLDLLTILLFSVSSALVFLQCFIPFHGSVRLQSLPSLQECFGIYFSVPVAALLVYALLNLTLGYSVRGTVVVDFGFLLMAGIVIATVALMTELLVSLLLRKAGVKRRVVLDLLPAEEIVLRKVLFERGLAHDSELLPRSMLRETFEAGAPAIDYLIISKERAGQFNNKTDLINAHLAGIRVLDSCHVCTHFSQKIALPFTDPWSYLHQALPQTFPRRAYREIKYLFEPLLAAVLLIALSPLLILIAVAIRSTSDGPILYRQTRLGYRSKLFTLIKFRTMHIDAEKDGPRWAVKDDKRVTKLGAFLRKTRLDELPQLWNVMRREMSFVGPRPERPEIYLELQDEIPLFTLRTTVRPGVTGWAQVKAGYAASVKESHLKLEYDLYYIQNLSLSLDVNVIVRTIMVASIGEHWEKRLSRILPRVRTRVKKINSPDSSYFLQESCCDFNQKD